MRGYLGALLSPVQAAESPDRPWRRAAISAAWVWLASHALLMVATFVRHLPRIADGQNPFVEVGPPPADLVMQWKWWDSYHYMIIAEHGYGDPPQTTAFYPFYPLVVRVFHLVVPGDMFYAAMVVSTISAFVLLMLLHRLVTFELGAELAGRTVFYLAAFPFAFFLHIGYNEALFMVFAIGALYCARIGRWWSAGLLAGLSSATRSVGVLLAAVILFEYLRQRGFRWRAIRFDVLSVGLAPAGLAAFAGYCWYKFDNPLEFSDRQDAWGRKLTAPWDTLWGAVRTLNDGPVLHPLNVYNFIDLALTLAAVAVLVLAVVGPWRLRPDQLYLVLYAALSLGLMVCFPVLGPVTMASFPRYLVELVPLFMVLARMGQNRNLERLYLMPAIGMQGIWMILFANHLWAG